MNLSSDNSASIISFEIGGIIFSIQYKILMYKVTAKSLNTMMQIGQFIFPMHIIILNMNQLPQKLKGSKIHKVLLFNRLSSLRALES